LQSAYCAAKHAVQGFTESLRSELIHDGSRVHLTSVQLPAVNTPQFSWIRTRMPRHPQPVPPIYQPEVIARAVYWAAHHRRRAFAVGFPTVQAIIGDKFIPGTLDHYLAYIGYESQQTQEPVQPRTIQRSGARLQRASLDESASRVAGLGRNGTRGLVVSGPFEIQWRPTAHASTRFRGVGPIV
jgi:hypothetical protein